MHQTEMLMEILSGHWVIHQVCPYCGQSRPIPLRDWFSFKSSRRLRSYCAKVGRSVYMRNLGWKREEDYYSFPRRSAQIESKTEEE